MGVLVEKIGMKKESFIKRSVKSLMKGFLDYADKGFWYIGK